MPVLPLKAGMKLAKPRSAAATSSAATISAALSLKINQVYEPLPDNPPLGYGELLIARDVAVPNPMTDPEGNRVVLMLTSGVIAGITET